MFYLIHIYLFLCVFVVYTSQILIAPLAGLQLKTSVQWFPFLQTYLVTLRWHEDFLGPQNRSVHSPRISSILPFDVLLSSLYRWMCPNLWEAMLHYSGTLVCTLESTKRVFSTQWCIVCPSLLFFIYIWRCAWKHQRIFPYLRTCSEATKNKCIARIPIVEFSCYTKVIIPLYEHPCKMVLHSNLNGYDIFYRMQKLR